MTDRKKSIVHDNINMKAPDKQITEEIRRPDHADYMTTAELKDMEFSGLRYNTLIETVEIWLLGNLERSISAPGCQPDPKKLNDAYIEVFGISLAEINIM